MELTVAFGRDDPGADVDTMQTTEHCKHIAVDDCALSHDTFRMLVKEADELLSCPFVIGPRQLPKGLFQRQANRPANARVRRRREPELSKRVSNALKDRPRGVTEGEVEIEQHGARREADRHHGERLRELPPAVRV
jgi:hypothetical protein